MPRDLQSSFTGGEISPSLHSRVDLNRYNSSLALCKNWQILAQGGISTRAGFEYICEVPEITSATRLIPFQFNVDQSYILVFSDLEMQVIKDGVLIVFSLVTTYAAADLFELRFTQSADVMTITHPSYPISDISRLADNNWTLTAKTFGSTATTPGEITVSQVGSGAGSDNKTYRYVITSTDENGSESVASEIATSGSVTSLTITYGNKLAWAQVAGTQYYTAYKEQNLNSDVFGYIGEIEAEATTAQNITGATAASPSVITIVGHGYVDGDNVFITGTSVAALDDKYFTVANATTDTFEVAANGTGWASGGTAIKSPQFNDFNIGPDMSFSPPQGTNPFVGAGNYPTAVAYHQQRQVYANTDNNPQQVVMSKSGDYNNMDTSRPTRSDDSISFTIASRQVNEILHLLSLDSLVAFTSDAPWVIEGDQSRVLTPSTINVRRQGGYGSSSLVPLTIGETALYVQSKGSRVRDLGYKFEDDKYVGNDLSIMAEHLFYGYTIVDWCYAPEPFGVVWAVRSDGVLLSLTYLKEHQVWGWAQHDTDGTFESVASIPEGDEDVVYAVVKRNINGADTRYVERLHSRRFTDIEDAFAVDCGITYDGAATTTITGLDHLEGETVVALADGNVVEDLVVASGSVTLPNAASVVHVGFNYNCDIETLDVFFEGGNQVVTRKKSIDRLNIDVRNSRGLKAGGSFDRMYEVKERDVSHAYGSIPAKTGEQRLTISTDWSDGGRVFIRQSYPLPATILAIIPEVVVSG